MSPINDSDLYLIEDTSGVSKKIRADNLRDRLATLNDHKLLVNLANYDSRFVKAQNLLDRVEDDHWMMVERGGVSYKVRGYEVKEHLTDVDGWNSVLTGTGGTNWTGVTYGDGKWVCVADSDANRVMVSNQPEGPWTSYTAVTGTAVEWYDIAYGNGWFVAVGENGRIMWTNKSKRSVDH